MENFFCKKRLIALEIVFIAFSTLLSAYSQNSGLRFDNITSRDGLADRTINTISQDARGFIWIGSGEGLTRYDGYTCVVYRHVSGNKQSLSDNQVYALCTDGDGVLWIGTRNGLNRYDTRNERFETFFHDSSDDHSISGNFVVTLAKDPAGNLWIGTYDGGLNKMIKTKKGYTFIHYRHDEQDSNSISNNQILSICFNKQDQAWIGTSNGLNLLQTKTNKFTQFYHRQGNKNSISNNTVNRIFADKDGSLWLCARGMLDNIRWQGNISQGDISVQHFLPLVAGNKKLNGWVINDFITDWDGNAWMASNESL